MPQFGSDYSVGENKLHLDYYSNPKFSDNNRSLISIGSDGDWTNFIVESDNQLDEIIEVLKELKSS